MQSQCSVLSACLSHNSSQTRALLCTKLQKTNCCRVRLAWQFPLCYLIKVKDRFHHRKKINKKIWTWKAFPAHFHHCGGACTGMLPWFTCCPRCPLCPDFCSFLSSLVKATETVLGQFILVSSTEKFRRSLGTKIIHLLGKNLVHKIHCRLFPAFQKKKNNKRKSENLPGCPVWRVGWIDAEDSEIHK